jgi:hypothetical protein
MRTELQMTCDKKQLSNGFGTFLKKYRDVRDKLNSSGFGVDPEVDLSLDKGLLLSKMQLL